MSHIHRHSGAHPLLIVLLAFPALTFLGLVKGCEMVERVTTDAQSAAAHEHDKPAPRPEPPRTWIRIEPVNGGWDI